MRYLNPLMLKYLWVALVKAGCMFVNKLYCIVIVWAYIFLGGGLKIYNMQSFVINLIYNYNRNNGSKKRFKIGLGGVLHIDCI